MQIENASANQSTSTVNLPESTQTGPDLMMSFIEFPTSGSSFYGRAQSPEPQDFQNSQNFIEEVNYSDMETEFEGNDDSEIEFRVSTESRNNKSRRPEVEICLMCDKEVNKMRDHLTNKHSIRKCDPLRKFILTHFSTLKTHRCFQCAICSVRFGDRGKHLKDHPTERIHDREDVALFAQRINLAVTGFLSNLLLPFKDFVQTWVKHEKGLFEDGDVSGKWNVSSAQITFLCPAIEASHKFPEPTQLAVFV